MSSNSNYLFRVGAEVLDTLFLFDVFIFFHVLYMLIFDRATYLSLPFKFILPERFRKSLWGLDVLLRLKIINVVSTLLYNFIEFFILLCSFLVISLLNKKICDLSDFI